MFRFFVSRLNSISIALLILGTVLLAGCGGSSVPEKYKDVEIKPVKRSPSIQDADVHLKKPDDEAVVENADIDLEFKVDSFETGIQTDVPRADSLASSEKGQHLHVIVDNKPYRACYDPSKPFDIGTLEPGVHTVIAFPSRSYHESVKGPGAYAKPGYFEGYAWTNFYVKEKKGEKMLNDDKVSVIYSRPKGTYTGKDAERILLDFYLHNVELGSYNAQYTVTTAEKGTEIASKKLTEWRPAYLTGLPSGTYNVTLELRNPDDETESGPFNKTTREIVVKKNAS
ncbi:MAG: hypothetical protein BRD55_11740 [Bacteroidetes bacterium SW_9_63_38]|nr:MAG: hypothetical protein BRD55_11740 [Bacteroidetes bacterium SW_9_63_38]